MDYEAILTEAHAAAKAAQMGMSEGYGLDCGFAWVRLDGTEALARHCRKQLKKDGEDFPDMVMMTRGHRYGDKGYPRGWDFWKPGNFRGQSISVHEKGAAAFRDVLAKYNIRAEVGSRLD